MSKVLRRPMFRKGGPTNGMTGIMSGIQDRKNYNVGTYPTDLGFGGNFGQGTRSAEELGYDFDFAVPTFKRGPNQSLEDLREQYSASLLEAAGDRGGYDPLTTFLLQYGPALANKTGGGSLIGNVVGAAEKPLQAMIREKAAEDKFKRGVKLQAAGKAIETKEDQDKMAMEIENKLEIAKADVINKGKELQNKIYANKELTDAERDNLLTQLASNRKTALEKIDAQYEGQLKLAKFEAENEPDETDEAIKASILKDDLTVYPGQPDVAKRSTDFKMTMSGELYKKVGGERIGGVLTFDINDPKQADRNKKAIKDLVGKIVYDPFADKYHKITKEGKITYNSIEEIPEKDLKEDKKDTGDKEKEGPKFKPEDPYSAFPGTIKAEKQKTQRFKDQAESFSKLPGSGITDFGDI